MTSIELKAKAYDTLAEIQRLEVVLRQLNQNIAIEVNKENELRNSNKGE